MKELLKSNLTKRHKRFRMAVEYSFNKQVTKFCPIDDYCEFWITQNEWSKWQ